MRFQFYKVRLKHRHGSRRSPDGSISILQSSIKTMQEGLDKEKAMISILQSSIKTKLGSFKLLRKLISILQSSIKTEEPVGVEALQGTFQFYKVRLKRTIALSWSIFRMISILQSSIKTCRAVDRRVQPKRISILQSSIKTRR